MRVSIEQLEVGDEIIISSHSNLKYMRVLQKPGRSKTKKHWRTGDPVWKDVKCAIHKKKFTCEHTGRIWEGFDCNPEDLNTTIYKDLTGRDIWLVKKGNYDNK